ncbi:MULTISPECIES: hypothetical protein [Paenibacillaceae]|uniref:Uncharacterized protein n=2 Tax=Paenibacillaceae TaxID=186822 RepID=A0A511VBC0_9BACL|nr:MULTISPECIES: hypothetical protein [Paenibacillaceae]MUG72724.1 hypothetical protein [Paenibacillus validus]GEN36134.1 hypothetical protein ADA01nite_35940 [Aneurinibacillus danicus]
MADNSSLFDMRELFAMLFSADSSERAEWLERITPAELEWYYEQQYIH